MDSSPNTIELRANMGEPMELEVLESVMTTVRFQMF